MRKEFLHSTQDTIAAISTPVGESGIGIVRLSGKKALSIADKVFASKSQGKVTGFKTYTVHYGHIVRGTKYEVRGTRDEGRGTKKEIIDEVILTVMRSPKSYTTEDVVEINCHGGIVALGKTLELVLEKGARMAQPGEFTKRAFINGRIDLAQAEAVLDIIKSKTENSMKIAQAQLEGELSKKIRGLRKSLIGVLAELEARIDFSEDDIEFAPRDVILKTLQEAEKKIKEMVKDSKKGMLFKEGVLCVICGKPNTGKSSLMNAFLRRQRVIVTPVAGTTRDAVEEEVILGGVPVRIADTAGISNTRGIVERHGIKRARSYIRRADLVLFMLDLGKRWTKEDSRILKDIKGKEKIVIANKKDLRKKLDTESVKKLTREKSIIEISVLKRKNLEAVEKAILAKIWRGRVPQPEGSFVTSLRQARELAEAHKRVEKALTLLKRASSGAWEISASLIREAEFFLGSILGDSIEPDILGKVFERFCIGK